MCSGAGVSTSGEHPTGAEYAFATTLDGKIDSTIILDGEINDGEAAHQAPDVAESARSCAFGGEVDSTTTLSRDGEYVESRGNGETDGARHSRSDI
ncbi:hypothetical protein LTR15_001793 [Elasticomyces elasticus]|nr:hypothetical protein LTR15_001793 [Elasticomyces elasticus]